MRTRLGTFMTMCLFLSLVSGCRSEQERAAAAARAKQQAAHIQMLKSWVPAETLKTVPPEFYTYDGFRDWWRFPLVYPYSISAIDTIDLGWLVRFNGSGPMTDWNKSTTALIGELSYIAFDEHILIGQIEYAPQMSWVVFDFRSGKYNIFMDKPEAIREAKKRGFAEEPVLESIRAQYEKCFPGD